jgi:single-strand DNA-binding protein
MASVSRVILIGNLGRDPETRFTQNGVMNLSFTMATNRRRTDQNGQPQDVTTWFRVTAWRRLAETMNTLAEQGALVKGRSVYVSGSLEAREYTDRQGVNRTSLDVNADEIQILGARADVEGGIGGEQRSGTGQGEEDAEPFDENSMDDVPF